MVSGRRMEQRVQRMRQGPLLPPPNLSLVPLLAPWLATMDLVTLRQRGHDGIVVVLTMMTTKTINLDDT
jgi:hypothetical protein